MRALNISAFARPEYCYDAPGFAVCFSSFSTINNRTQRFAHKLSFAGRKDSAEGTLSVTDALRSFSIRSMVAAKQTAASEDLLDSIVMRNKSKFINTRFIF